MAGVDPYASCPCGSGEKFKWCCHKMESYADRAQRLYETGQTEAAIGVLDDGLRKEPANAWLLMRKALILIRANQAEAAKASLRELIHRQPQHVGGHSLLVRCVIETEGPLAAIDAIQQSLSAVSEEARPGLAAMVAITGTLLARIGHYQAALAHVSLARAMTAEDDDDRPSRIESAILGDSTIMPWLKSSYELAEQAVGIDADRAEQFGQAIEWADSGLWSSAASAFEILSASVEGPEADRNLGLCRLWLADDEAAVTALRRAIRKMGTTEEAVDFEALCQLIEPVGTDDKVEHVQLIWPLRDRDSLLAALRSQKDIEEEGTGPINPTELDSPEAVEFLLLDRPPLPDGKGVGLTVGDLPQIVGRVAVGREIAALEGDDNGSLDALSHRFTGIAGHAIAPAHPKTKVLGTMSKLQSALYWQWLPPQGMDQTTLRRLTDEEQSRLIREVWPVTPMPYLGGRTPRQAASDGDATVPLRAACCQLERQHDLSRSRVDIVTIRTSMRIGPEPEVNPVTVNLASLNYARYSYLPVERLDDDPLVMAFLITQSAALVLPLGRAARAIASRPSLIGSGQVSTVTIYTELINAAINHDDPAEGFRLIDEGRRAEPASRRAASAMLWDMLEIGLKTRTEDPESWVPELAIVLDRYRDNQAASQALLMALLEMGLVEMVPNPDKPGEQLLDPRILQSLMAKYGPRVATASGQLGVSATKGGIWTPGAESGATPGGIWTPGSSPPSSSGAEKPRLIIPGR